VKHDRPLGSVFCCAAWSKNQKKSPPTGKFGLVFGLLGFLGFDLLKRWRFRQLFGRF